MAINPTTTSPAKLLSAILMIERLHRLLLDVVTDALDRARIDDVTAVHATMLYNIADQELTFSELRARDYYTGSNSFYIVKKLVEGGSLCYAKSPIDRRTVQIGLGERGKEIHTRIHHAYQRHAATVEHLGGIQPMTFQIPRTA